MSSQRKTPAMLNFEFGSRTYLMGVLNLTPDSFSSDGIYNDVEKAVERSQKIAEEGADIIDIGGESTRPGSLPVTLEEEIKRVVPVIEKIAKKARIPVSIDTRKAEVARMALDKGAKIINDISGLCHDERMLEIARQYDAGVIIMHMKGTPENMQVNPVYNDLIAEIIERLSFLVKKAEAAGIKKENIIVDPGIGFGKAYEHNLEILNNLSCFKALQKPILVGTSRKSFIGKLLGVEPQERVFGTAATVALAIKNGASIVRVHDVKEMKEVANVTDAILRASKN